VLDFGEREVGLSLARSDRAPEPTVPAATNTQE
jgi:hypothetical protein